MKLMEIDNLIYAWLDPALKCWHYDQIRNMQTNYYLYYKEGNSENHGCLVIAENPLNESYKLATPYPVPKNMNVNAIKQMYFELAKKLPILCTK